MRQKSKLRNKLEAFHEEIDGKRLYLKKEKRHRMRLQADQEFNQNEIKIFYSKLNEGQAVGAEQKIRELKEGLRNFKRIEKTKIYFEA